MAVRINQTTTTTISGTRGHGGPGRAGQSSSIWNGKSSGTPGPNERLATLKAERASLEGQLERTQDKNDTANANKEKKNEGKQGILSMLLPGIGDSIGQAAGLSKTENSGEKKEEKIQKKIDKIDMEIAQIQGQQQDQAEGYGGNQNGYQGDIFPHGC